MSIAEKLTTIAENVQKVFDAGKEAERDKFWDEFQQNGNRMNYRYAFYDNYTDEMFHPKYPFKCVNNCSNMFQYCKLTKIEQTVDFSVSTQTAISSVFANTVYLETISDLRVKSGLSIANWFTSAKALKNITITGEIDLDASFVDCPLSDESIDNIISCLKELPDGTTKTLTVSDAVYNRMVERNKVAEVIAKNWSLVSPSNPKGV